MAGLDGTQCDLCGSIDWRSKYILDGINVVECKSCSLITLSYIPTLEELRAMYAEQYFQERKSYFFDNPVIDQTKQLSNECIHDFCHGLKLLKRFKSKGRLLDVGCGIGIFMALAKKEGWEISGMDISSYSIKMARDILGIEAILGDLTESVFEERSFDIVTLWDTLEHFSNPSEQLQEIWRILKNDGILLINTPNESSLLKLMAATFFKLSFGRFDYPARKLYHRYHLFYYTPHTIQALMKKNGFEIVYLERKSIPIERGRKSQFEKLVVKGLSLIERLVDREFELLLIAQKRIDQQSAT